MTQISIFNMTDSWTDSGTMYDAIKMNVSNTGSAANSNLLLLQVNGADKFRVEKSGVVNLRSVNAESTVNTSNLVVTQTANIATANISNLFISSLATTGTVNVGALNVNTLSNTINLSVTDTTNTNNLIVRTSANIASMPALTIISPSQIQSNPAINVSQTWNNSSAGFTALKINIANTNSGSTSNVIDMLIDNVSVASITKLGQGKFSGGNYNVPWISTHNGVLGIGAGNGTLMQFIVNGTEYVGVSAGSLFQIGSGMAYSWSSGINVGNIAGGDTFITRKTAASIQFGLADAAAPITQNLSFQGVVAGTSNTAGANASIRGSASTGIANGGAILFQVTPASTPANGTVQNAQATAMTINGDRRVDFMSGVHVKSNGISSHMISGMVSGGNFIADSIGTEGSGMQFWNGGSLRISMYQGGGQLQITNSGLFRGLTVQPAPDSSWGNALYLNPTFSTASANLTALNITIANTNSGSNSMIASYTVGSNVRSTLDMNGHMMANTVRCQATVFANLPASPITGTKATITDANTTVWRSVIGGGGANTILGWYDGTIWRCYG